MELCTDIELTTAGPALANEQEENCYDLLTTYVVEQDG
jgi:hypothetical protein